MLAGSVVVGRVKAGLTVRGVPARAVSTTSGPQNLPTDLDERVRQVVQETFDLPVPPQASDGPHQIPAWDSLGALRLIVNLEQGLGVVLPEGVFGPEPTVARITERIATHFM